MTRSASVLLALVAFAAMTPAQADEFADCERQGLAYGKKQGDTLTRIQIERVASPIVNRYDDKVGSQPVVSEILGFARLTRPDGVKRQRYLCLHDGKRAVYFGTFLD